MDWTHIIIAIAGVVLGWVVKHYQIPTGVDAVVKAMEDVKKRKALADVHEALGVAKDKPAS